MRNLVTLYLIFLSLSMFGQPEPRLDSVVVKMWALDSQNNRDSVIFGYDKYATNGIDTQLGEKDIIGQAYNNILELRGFQRKYESQICTSVGFYSIYDFDTKINLRNIYTAGNTFEFIIKGRNYPIQVYADFKSLFDNTDYRNMCQILLYDNLCQFQKMVGASYTEKLLFTIENETQNIIQVRLDYIFDGISEINSERSEYNIFPTFVTDNLTIQSKINNRNNFIGIYNSLGQIVIDKVFSSSLKLDLKTLKQGIYFIQLKSENRTKIETFKITKK